jgi:putative ABC transport system permease protein
VLLPDLPAGLAIVDGRVLLFTFGVVAATVLLAGLLPALHASRTDLVDALKTGGHGSTARAGATRSALLVTQIALTLALLVGAGLFVRSLRNVQDIDPGFDVAHLIMMRIQFGQAGFSDADANADYLRLVDRLRQLPGVADAAATMGNPFGMTFGTYLRIAGRDSLPVRPGGGPYMQAVTPSYFATMGAHLLRGRGITESDVKGSGKVAVINAAFAAAAWPGENPLGRCLYTAKDATACTTVVGIVTNAKRNDVTETDNMLYYLPLAQYHEPQITAVFVRTRGPAAAMVGPVRREIRVIPNLPYANIQPMAARLAPDYQSWKLGATAFTAFGLLALLIAATGIFAVLSYLVSQRTREVGLRVALGAQSGDVVRLVVTQGLRAAVIGLVVGVAAAALLARAMASLLYGISPGDPLVYLSMVAVLLATALVAAYLPARRAARVDPMIALRSE